MSTSRPGFEARRRRATSSVCASAIALLRVPIRKPCPDTRSPFERDQRLQRLALLPDAMDRIQLLDISGISNGNHRACAWSPTLHGDLGLSLPGFTPACLEGCFGPIRDAVAQAVGLFVATKRQFSPSRG